MPILLCRGVLQKVVAQNVNLEAQASSIHGTVVNSATHEPIGRALVFSPDNRFATMTDDQGHFEFALPQPEARPQETTHPEAGPGGKQDGRWGEDVHALMDDQERSQFISATTSPNRPAQLTARKPGFLDEDEGGQRYVSVAPGQKGVSLSLTPEALVVGRVVVPDESDRIVVEIYHRQVQEGRGQWIPAGSAVAKSNGEFRFAGLRAGKYKLLTRELLDRDPLTFDPHGQLYGYPPVYFPSDLTSEGTIALSTGSTFQASLSPVRQAYYQVRVPVANAAPGAQIRVDVSAQGRRGPGFSLGYNQQEQRIEGLLPDGTYTIEALNYGPPALAGAVNITVKGGAMQGPAMALVPSSSVAVNVKEEFSSTDNPTAMTWNNNGHAFQVKGPRRYLNITLWPADEFSLENVAGLAPPSGSGDESLVLHDVQPGRYWVQVNSSRGFPASITSGGTDLQQHPLVVGWGGTASPIEITMRDDWAQIGAKIEHADELISRTSSISGFEPASETVTPAWVCLVPLPDSSGQFQQTWMSPVGESGDQQIPPGEYRVLAFDHQQPELEYRNPEAMQAYDGKGQVVRLVGGQKERITLPLISAGESR